VGTGGEESYFKEGSLMRRKRRFNRRREGYRRRLLEKTKNIGAGKGSNFLVSDVETRSKKTPLRAVNLIL